MNKKLERYKLKIKRKLGIPFSEEEKKKIEKAKRTERRIQDIMKKSGWTHEETVANVEAAKERMNITYREFEKYDFHKYSLDEQEIRYRQICEKIELNQEKSKEKMIKKVMKATGWSYEQAKADMEDAQARTGCFYKEYYMYRFWELDKELQESLFLMRHSDVLQEKYAVGIEKSQYLCNKELTNVLFADYVKRPWCVNTKASKEDFMEKFKDSKRIIYKPLSGNCGKGVEAFFVDKNNLEKVYEMLSEYPDGVVEEYVVQHPAISEISPSSVNTVRFVTFSSNTKPVTADGKLIDFAYAALRIGAGDSVVDNFHSGGMVAAVDLETGKIVTDAADMTGKVFKTHPATGVAIRGRQIPLFDEAVAMVKDALEKTKIEGYLGWDIAITENGPVLIELNLTPAVVLLQAPYVAERVGKKHIMDRYL